MLEPAQDRNNLLAESMVGRRCLVVDFALDFDAANLTRGTTRIPLRSLVASLSLVFWDQPLGPANISKNTQACENR